jgi:hydrogenase nickel incorporation protein HypB
MCNTCGCNVTHGNEQLLQPGGKLAKTDSGNEAVTVLKNLLHENDHTAMHNREHFDSHNVLAINLMSSPGAGKTALLEATIQSLHEHFGDGLNIAVIEGDLETENDAERIRRHGVKAIQITTGSACHLDAHMIHDALHHLELAPLDVVFIENVGNLVCPASFDLGQHINVALLSTPEGDDKPAKYPVMFRAADLVLVSKCDLLAVLDDFKPERAKQYLHDIASAAPVIELSAKTGAGMAQWFDWLKQQIAQQRTRSADASVKFHRHHPHHHEHVHAQGHHHQHDGG